MTDSSDKTTPESPKCFLCNATDEQVPLFRVLFKGRKRWACAQCVPTLVHGPQ